MMIPSKIRNDYMVIAEWTRNVADDDVWGDIIEIQFNTNYRDTSREQWRRRKGQSVLDRSPKTDAIYTQTRLIIAKIVSPDRKN